MLPCFTVKIMQKVQLLVGKHKVENDKLTTFIVMKAVTEFNHLKKRLYSSVTTTGNVLSHFPLLLFYLLQCCPSLLYCCEHINWMSLLITMHFKNGSICVHHTCIVSYIYVIYFEMSYWNESFFSFSCNNINLLPTGLFSPSGLQVSA